MSIQHKHQILRKLKAAWGNDTYLPLEFYPSESEIAALQGLLDVTRLAEDRDVNLPGMWRVGGCCLDAINELGLIQWDEDAAELAASKLRKMGVAEGKRPFTRSRASAAPAEQPLQNTVPAASHFGRNNNNSNGGNAAKRTRASSAAVTDKSSPPPEPQSKRRRQLDGPGLAADGGHASKTANSPFRKAAAKVPRMSVAPDTHDDQAAHCRAQSDRATTVSRASAETFVTAQGAPVAATDPDATDPAATDSEPAVAAEGDVPDPDEEDSDHSPFLRVRRLRRQLEQGEELTTPTPATPFDAEDGTPLVDQLAAKFKAASERVLLRTTQKTQAAEWLKHIVAQLEAPFRDAPTATKDKNKHGRPALLQGNAKGIFGVVSGEQAQRMADIAGSIQHIVDVALEGYEARVRRAQRACAPFQMQLAMEQHRIRHAREQEARGRERRAEVAEAEQALLDRRARRGRKAAAASAAQGQGQGQGRGRGQLVQYVAVEDDEEEEL